MNRSNILEWTRRVAVILFLIVAAMVSRCVHPYPVHEKGVVNFITPKG
jgi:hypothetical protein